MNRHCHLKILAALAALAWAAGAGLAADVPGHISYQGMLMDGGASYTGEASFKFALVDSLTGDYFWTNDGSQGPPAEAIRIPVQDGLFSVLLGAAPMAPIDPSAISNFTRDQALRIWVEIGSHGEVLLGNLPLSSVLFAHQAELARASDGDFTAAGEIWSQSGGFKFPDGTVQETAASSSGGDCLWSAGTGGRIFYNAGNVGIGTDNPIQKLTLGDPADNANYLRFNSTNYAGLLFHDSAGLPVGRIVYEPSGNLMRFYTNQTERMRIASNGNVGIGTTSPEARLHIDGTARVMGFQLGTTATAGHVLTADASGAGTWQAPPAGGVSYWINDGEDNIYYDNGYVGIGTDHPQYPLSLEMSYDNNIVPMAILRTTGTGSAAAVRFQNASDHHFNLGIIGGSHLALGYNANIGLAGDLLRITPDGDVGLGLTNPAAKLDVDGTVKMTGMQLGTSATEGHVLTADASGVGTWQPAPTGGAGPWQINGSNIYYDAGKVGIGTASPYYPLHLEAANSSRGAYIVNERVPQTGLPTYGLYSAAEGGAIGITDAKNIGVTGKATNAEKNYGVTGSASNGTSNYGVWGSAICTGATSNYGVYGTASGGTWNRAIYGSAPGEQSWAGYFVGRGYFSGNVGIGLSDSPYPLTVISGTQDYAATFTNHDDTSYSTHGILSQAVGDIGGAPGSIHTGVKAHAAYADWNFGLYASASDGAYNYAGYFVGDTHVTGTLSKGAGSFKIDHPLDPANKYLSHSFVESPDMMNIYNGNVVTDGSGRATIQLPDWFETLNRDFRYQLTVIDETDSAEFVLAKIIRGVKNGSFAIRTSAPNATVSWQVTGIRQDAYANAHRIAVEEDKPSQERGTYLHPEALGLPADLQVDRVREARIENHR